MGHYDLFSAFYDLSVEQHYRSQRAAAADALALRTGLTVLDLPCGTGLSLPHLREGVGDGGAIVGVDASPGMLAKARRRAEREGWTNVHLVESNVDALAAEALGPVGGTVDRLHVFLGLSAFPDADAGFEKAWALLRPGGRCVVVDCYAETLSFQGRMVNWTAKADITRRTWEPLERRAEGYRRVDLPSTKAHGGQLFLASGDKPG